MDAGKDIDLLAEQYINAGRPGYCNMQGTVDTYLLPSSQPHSRTLPKPACRVRFPCGEWTHSTH